jgi:hypothetical protein
MVAPQARGLMVAPQARGLMVAPEARGLMVAPEARGLMVAPEARGLMVAPQARGLMVAPQARGPMVRRRRADRWCAAGARTDGAPQARVVLSRRGRPKCPRAAAAPKASSLRHACCVSRPCGAGCDVAAGASAP